MGKVELSICVGSSCHLKGSKDVVDEVKEEIAKRRLQEQVELKAAFCLGECGHSGVTVKINDKVLPEVTPAKVSALFDAEILPLLG